MISASLVIAIFVLLLVSIVFSMISGKFATLRFAAVICILFGWGCTALAVIAIIIAVIWFVLMAIVHADN
jgi:hypothetical protein